MPPARTAPLLQGVIPSMVTPLRTRDQLDVPGLDRLVAHLLEGGVHGVCVLGPAGESAALSCRLRRELIGRACRIVGGRVPVLVGVSDTAIVEILETSRFAADCGATALVIAPPGGPGEPEPAEIVAYVRHLAPQLPLPLLLQNPPRATRLSLSPRTLRDALDISNVAGVLDCSGDTTLLHRLLASFDDPSDTVLFTGADELLGETLLLGGHGGLCAGANLCPRLHVELHAAAQARDVERLVRLHTRVTRLSSALAAMGRDGSASVKSALQFLGVCDDVMAEPFRRLGASERGLLAARLDDLGLSSFAASAPTLAATA